jgi:hypothetical protein
VCRIAEHDVSLVLEIQETSQTLLSCFLVIGKFFLLPATVPATSSGRKTIARTQKLRLKKAQFDKDMC